MILPIIVLVTFATIETCTALYKKQYLEIVAFEGARVGVVPGAESANVMYKCEMLLQAANVVDYTITAIPSDPTTLEAGDYFTVEITAPLSSLKRPFWPSGVLFDQARMASARSGSCSAISTM